MIKAALFDLDGTLLNTLTDLYLCVNYALKTHNLSLRTIDEVRRFLGNGIQYLIHCSVPEGTSADTEKKTFDTFVEYYEKHCSDNTAPYDKIGEVLKTLRSNGVKVAIVSNKADFAAQILCKKYFPDGYDFALGAKEGLEKKPASDMINAALKSLGNIEKEDCVYIGDSEVDIMTAKNANMPCISVSWGFRDYDELVKAGAMRIVNKPNEIVSFIKESNRGKE